MAFALKPAESVPKGVRRLIGKQIDKALEGLRRPNGNVDEVVHDARKRFKKVRALLRLVRPELGDKVYRQENTCFRDAGRPLTEVRDAEVLLEALQKLTKHFADQVSAGAFAGVRKALQAHRQAVRTQVLKEQHALTHVADAIEGARGRMDDWSMDHNGWAALAGGLKRVYQQGRAALARAAAEDTVENLHEWRKQAKYLWHQVEALEPLWPAVLKELAEQIHELTQLLGDNHDLAVLRQTVTADPDRYGGDSTLETLLALTDRRRDELEQEALRLGQRIYSDRPRDFTQRLRDYWKTWRAEA